MIEAQTKEIASSPRRVIIFDDFGVNSSWPIMPTKKKLSDIAPKRRFPSRDRVWQQDAELRLYSGLDPLTTSANVGLDVTDWLCGSSLLYPYEEFGGVSANNDLQFQDGCFFVSQSFSGVGLPTPLLSKKWRLAKRATPHSEIRRIVHATFETAQRQFDADAALTGAAALEDFDRAESALRDLPVPWVEVNDVGHITLQWERPPGGMIFLFAGDGICTVSHKKDDCDFYAANLIDYGLDRDELPNLAALVREFLA
jgi:hypothetical protein